MRKCRLTAPLCAMLAGLATAACSSQTDEMYTETLLEENHPAGVTSVEELKDALADAKEGEVIDVEKSLDLTAAPLAIHSDVTLHLPANVTLTTQRSDEGPQTAGIYVAPDATLTLNGEGTLTGDNRIVDVDGTLCVDGVTFRTTTNNRGSAITVNADGKLCFEQGTVDAAFAALWIEGEADLHSGSFTSTSSSQNPSLENNPAWSYTIRIEGDNPEVTIDEGVYVEGVHGCVAMEPYGGTCVINGGTFVTHPRFSKDDNYSALTLIGGECTVNGGHFYAENSKCLWVAVDEEYKELYLRGGWFSDKGYYGVQLPDGTSYSQDDVVPDEGYEWLPAEEITDGCQYHYKVVSED